MCHEGRGGQDGLAEAPAVLGKAARGAHGCGCAGPTTHAGARPRARYLCSFSRRYFSRSAPLIFSRGCRWPWCVFTFWLST